MKKGKFIIIEGTDGSGKTTQLKLLAKYLKNKKFKVKTLDFPQYDQFWGKLVGRFLKGEFGELDDLNPYIVAPLYFLDQATQAENIKRWLLEGYYVLSNRYVTSSMAHQTAKFQTKYQQDKFLDWFVQATYKELKMPKENLTITLYVDPRKSQELAKKSRKRKQNYTEGKDIAEDHFRHLIDSANMYKKLCKKYGHWKLINCMLKNNGEYKIDSIENIHSRIVETIEKIV